MKSADAMSSDLSPTRGTLRAGLRKIHFQVELLEQRLCLSGTPRLGAGVLFHTPGEGTPEGTPRGGLGVIHHTHGKHKHKHAHGNAHDTAILATVAEMSDTAPVLFHTPGEGTPEGTPRGGLGVIHHTHGKHKHKHSHRNAHDTAILGAVAETSDTAPVLFHTPGERTPEGTPRIGAGTLFHTPESGTAAQPKPIPPAWTNLTSGILDLGNGLVALLTSESAQHRDLNHDGDKLDQVLQSFDAELGVTKNSGQAAIGGSLIDIGNGLAAFLTNEAEQGRSLNGDHDKLDQVLQVFDARSGEVRSSRQAVLAGSLVDLGSGQIAFLTPESAQNRNLNSDQDKLDNVLQAFDFFANVVRNSGLQAVAGSILDVGDGLVVFRCDEAAQSKDLNADGDKRDQVLQAFDAADGVTRNSGTQVVAGSESDIGQSRVAFVTSESAQDRKLNGDGDRQDFVVQVFDAVLGMVQNTGQAVT